MMRKWIGILIVGLICACAVLAYNGRMGRSSTGLLHGLSPAPFRTLAELNQNSEAVAVATVVSVESTYDPQNRLVITSSMVRVDKSLKGRITEGETFPVRVVGGKDGERSTPFVDSMLPLDVGTEQVLFLKWYQSPSRPELTGWALSGGYQARALVQRDGLLKAVGKDGPLHSLDGKPLRFLEDQLSK